MAVRELGVWLDGVHVADLKGPAIGRVSCRYRPEAVEKWTGNVPLLSCSLPLRSGRQNAWAFTTGLLPEGQHRQSMAALAGVTTSNVMGMLDRFGRDVAGAVIISADDPPLREPGVEPYTSDELIQEIATLDEHPLGLHDDSELSIAGLQDKMVLVKIGADGWGRPKNGYPSTHILKVDDRLHRGLVRAEHACLELASTVGLSAPHSQLQQVADTEVLIVERFDRRVNEVGQVNRVHQEDACQALGIDPEHNQRRAKYEAFGGPSLASIAKLLSRWASDPRQELERLLDLVVFTVLIGNADAHGKNVGLLHPRPGTIEMAPLYDQVPTMLWPQLRTDSAMRIGGRSRLPATRLNDVVNEAASWQVPVASASKRVTELAERVRTTLRSEQVNVDTPALAAIAERTERFLSDP